MTVAALVAAFLLVGSVSQAHVKGCHSARCDRVAQRACARHAACELRVLHKRWHRTADPYWGIFTAISYCESHGNWSIEGYFSGGIQFTDQSWHSVGGLGRAGEHSKLEQIYRGVLLQRIQGWGAWPVCRHSAGV